MDESGSELSDEARVPPVPELIESICEDPVITRMPGPVQEVFHQLGLVQAFFLRSQGNQDHIVLQQSCSPFNVMLSRYSINPGTTLWLRGKSDRSGLVSSIADIMGILSFFGGLNYTQERDVYWTTDGFLCSSFAAGCTQPSECTGIVRFAVQYQIAEVDGVCELTIRHISIDAREFIFPTLGIIDENSMRTALTPITNFLGYFLLSVMCVLGVIEKS